MYVLPAIAVMLIVIAYPIYYTIELSFFKTPPGLQLREQDLHRLRQLHGHPHQRRPKRPARLPDLDTCIHLDRLCPGFATALALHGDFSGRGVLRAIRMIPWVIHAPPPSSYLEVDLPFGLRDHRRGAGRPWIGRPAAEFHRQRQHGAALPDRRQYLREFPFAMIMMMAGLEQCPMRRRAESSPATHGSAFCTSPSRTCATSRR